MAQTVSTATSAAVTALAAEVVKRVDWRPLADLCSDTGTRLASSAAVQADTNFLAIVRDAFAEIESACQKGGRYLPVDITALLADTGAAAGKFLRILSRVVVMLAYERRPDKEPGDPAVITRAQEALQQLADGERVFSFEETRDAGRFSHEVETATDVENRDGITYQADRYFGRRGNRRAGLTEE